MSCRLYAGRYLRCYHDDDGALIVEASLPAESGELVMHALDAVMDADTEARWHARPVDKVSAETSAFVERWKASARGAPTRS